MALENAGRVADFHSLRHTFITNLVRGGVHPKVAQQLARHSTITLTMDRYSHTVIGDLADGLNALPNLSPSKPERERLRATGSCDIVPKTLPLSLPISLPTRVASQTSPVASRCTKTANDRSVSHQEYPTKQGASCTPLHRVAPHCVKDVSQAAVGVEPTNNGFAIRPLSPLGYAANTGRAFAGPKIKKTRPAGPVPFRDRQPGQTRSQATTRPKL